MNDRGRLGLPGLGGLTPHFAVTVLECHKADPASAFVALRRHLRETLANPGRATAVRLRGEVMLTDPDDELDGLGTLADLSLEGIYVLVRERWQSPRWAPGEGDLDDLTNELTVVVRRQRLVALHTPVSGSLLRRWTRTAGSPYRFLSESVLAETFPEGAGGIVASPAWSRLTSPARLDFTSYLAETVSALDQLAKAITKAAG